MTTDWIETRGTPLAPYWELWHRVLGLYAMPYATIDHQGVCTICMPLSHTKFPCSLGHCLIVVLLCTYSSLLYMTML